MAEDTHETKLRITGDESSAVRSISAVINGIKGVRTAVSKVMNALGVVGMALNGINVAIEWYKKLSEWIHRAETAAKNLREELAKTSYEVNVAHAAASYEKLTKQIAEANRLERERNEILEKRKAYERDLEDASAERNKQMEISKLDPNDTNYAERKKEIERKYEIEASDRKAARAGEDVKGQAAALYREADRKDAEAASREKEWKKQDNIVSAAQEKSWAAAMKARNGGDAEKEEAKKADEEFKRQFDKAKKIREEIDALMQEAQSIRNKAGELVGGNVAANILNEANKRRIANEEKAEVAKDKISRDENLRKKANERKMLEEIASLDPTSSTYDRDKSEIEQRYKIKALKEKRGKANTDEDRQAIDEETRAEEIRYEHEKAQKNLHRDQNLEDKQLEKMMQEDLAALNPNDPQYAQKKKEIENTYEIKAAELKRDRATNEEDRQAADEERLAIGIRQERERREEEASRIDDYYGNLAESASRVRGDRLTEMGLGSGVNRTAEDQANNVKLLVQLAKEQLQATRDNKPGSAIYAP